MSALGQRAVRGRLQELDVASPPFGAPRQDQPVAAVAVGAEQVGVHDHDAQWPAHAGAPSRSWKAV